MKPKPKIVDVEAYKKFLLSSPVFDAATNEMFRSEPLAMALLSVLGKHGVIDHHEVTEAFDDILRSRFVDWMNDLERDFNAPSDFLIDDDRFDV